MMDQSNLFAADTLAKASLSPGSEKARMMTAGSGRKCLLASKNTGPVGLLEKMLLDTLVWGSTTCFLTWKVRATPAGRSVFQLVPSTPDTAGTDCGYWLTVRASDSGGKGDLIQALRGNENSHYRLLPTASARDYKDTPGMAREGTNPDGSKRKRVDQLARAIYAGLYQTPTVTNAHGNAQGPKNMTLPYAVKMFPTPKAAPSGPDFARMDRPEGRRRLHIQIVVVVVVIVVAAFRRGCIVSRRTGVARGIPSRVDRLKLLGNAVVPQIPEMLGYAILEAEDRFELSTSSL